jgi:hypothetical protein
MSRRHLVEAAVFALMLLIFFVFLFLYISREPSPGEPESGAITGVVQS